MVPEILGSFACQKCCSSLVLTAFRSGMQSIRQTRFAIKADIPSHLDKKSPECFLQPNTEHRHLGPTVCTAEQCQQEGPGPGESQLTEI